VHNKNYMQQIIKAENDRQIFTAIVYQPNVVDSQGDWAKAIVIEEACHEFNVGPRDMTLMHVEKRDDLVLLESFISPADFELGNQKIKKGTWMVVVKVHSTDTWQPSFELRCFRRNCIPEICAPC